MDVKWVVGVVFFTLVTVSMILWDFMTDAAVLQDVAVYAAFVVVGTVLFTWRSASNNALKSTTVPTTTYKRRNDDRRR